MFGGTKIKLDSELVAKVKKYADIAGYSSPEEFITHALEKELSKLEGADSEEEIKKRLRGLGYISYKIYGCRCRRWRLCRPDWVANLNQNRSESTMHTINTILGYIFGAIMLPFRDWPTVGLILISVVVSVGILLIFKKVSNQVRIDAVKRKIQASLFEIRLFNDDLGAILRAQLDILRHNASYLRLQLFPLLFILPPVIIIMAQLQPYYGYKGLEVGESVLLKVAMQPSGEEAEFLLSDKPAITLDVPAGLELQTPAVWVPSKGLMVWRMAATEPGDFELQIQLDGESYTKSVRSTDRTVRRSPLRATTVGDQFLYPVEAPLAKDGPIRSISVGYPEDPEFLLMPRWMWIFFVLTIVFAFALRKPMGVTI